MDAEIKELYDQLSKKGEFIIHLAKIVKRSPKTLKVHWFSKDEIIGMPNNPEIKKITLRELRKAPKKQLA